MNKKQKTVIYCALTVVIISLLTWIAFGREIFTKTQVLIEKKDELFPDMMQKVWEDRFIWGLDLSAAISGITLISAIILIYFFKTKKNS